MINPVTVENLLIGITVGISISGLIWAFVLGCLSDWRKHDQLQCDCNKCKRARICREIKKRKTIS